MQLLLNMCEWYIHICKHLFPDVILIHFTIIFNTFGLPLLHKNRELLLCKIAESVIFKALEHTNKLNSHLLTFNVWYLYRDLFYFCVHYEEILIGIRWNNILKLWVLQIFSKISIIITNWNQNLSITCTIAKSFKNWSTIMCFSNYKKTQAYCRIFFLNTGKHKNHKFPSAIDIVKFWLYLANLFFSISLFSTKLETRLVHCLPIWFFHFTHTLFKLHACVTLHMNLFLNFSDDKVNTIYVKRLAKCKIYIKNYNQLIFSWKVISVSVFCIWLQLQPICICL